MKRQKLNLLEGRDDIDALVRAVKADPKNTQLRLRLDRELARVNRGVDPESKIKLFIKAAKEMFLDPSERGRLGWDKVESKARSFVAPNGKYIVGFIRIRREQWDLALGWTHVLVGAPTRSHQLLGRLWGGQPHLMATLGGKITQPNSRRETAMILDSLTGISIEAAAETGWGIEFLQKAVWDKETKK